jgi:flagellar hook assembly protein FlgD
MNCVAAEKNIAGRWLWLISLLLGLSVNLSARTIVISPNGDEKNDFARISYYNPDGNFPRVRIYNLDGRLIADEQVITFYNNYPDVTWVWDGRDNNARTVPAGIYIYLSNDGSRKYSGSILVVR